MNNKIVRLTFDKNPIHYSSHAAYKQDVETWITMLEQMLLCDYQNYTIKIHHDFMSETIKIAVQFDTIEDATHFRLRHG